MKCFLYSVIFFFMTQVLFAQVDFSGYGASGYKWYDRSFVNGYHNKVYYEGKLQADITVTKHVDAQIDLRGHSDDNTVEFREFSAKFDYFKGFKIKIGHLRKPFGLDQFVDKDERDLVDDSYIHRELDERGYAGRAVMLMVYHKYKKKDENSLPYSYYVSLYKDNSLAYGAIGRFEYNADSFIAGSGVFLQHNSAGAGVTTLATSADISFDFGWYLPSVEVIYAQDPIEELQRKASGFDEKVNTLGIKSHHKTIFDTDSDVITSVQPFLTVGSFFPDLKTTRTYTIQTVIGVNVYFEPEVRLRLNGDLLLHKDKYTSKYYTNDSRVTIEVQVRF